MNKEMEMLLNDIRADIRALDKKVDKLVDTRWKLYVIVGTLGASSGAGGHWVLKLVGIA